MEKIIKCKFCGQMSAVGQPSTKDSDVDKLLRGSVRVLGSAASAMSGRIGSAISFATGKVDKSIDQITSKISGGCLFHFTCINPECGQCFDKIVY